MAAGSGVDGVAPLYGGDLATMTRNGSEVPPVVPPPGGPGPDRAPGLRHLLVVLLAPLLASAAILIVGSTRLDSPFSTDFVGFNTAVWATGSQAVRSDGWWDTRLGAEAGLSAEDVPYAHHPPLVRVEVAVSEILLGEHRWVDRLPALLSSLAAIWLCWGWLGACRFSPGSRSLGVLALGGTGLMLSYGVMLNMEAIWLPFAFALLWAWQRAERRSGGFWSCFALGVIGCTAAHQGMLLVGALAALGVIQAVRARRRPRPHEAAAIAASAVGVGLFATWVIWASGGLSDLVRIAGERSSDDYGWTEFLRTQVLHSRALFGVVGLICLAAGALFVRRRPDLVGQMAVIWAVTGAYALGFRQGATIHLYWNAALVPAIALGGALLGDRLLRSGDVYLRVACVAAAAMMFLSAMAAGYATVHSDSLGLLARLAGERQVTALYSTQLVAEWATYESGGPVEPAYTCAAVRRVAATSPDAGVLTSAAWLRDVGAGADGWGQVVASPDSTVGDGFALTSARTLASAC